MASATALRDVAFGIILMICASNASAVVETADPRNETAREAARPPDGYNRPGAMTATHDAGGSQSPATENTK